ncbi:hypothetical protein D9757_001705 [Collybiopsis confluens]|uniref:Protein kinase domain-containing protein n=1 Tax=Collybiopsis confluens TaxID=2823264 RepID=A0A8H5MFJ8_9AGAR|nr:hypothetical protein D9757_001705 [Collybiopsis confluens]
MLALLENICHFRSSFVVFVHINFDLNPKKRLYALRNSTMFAAATSAASSFFARTNISQSYNIGYNNASISSSSSGSRSSTPGPQNSTPADSPIVIGLWKVQGATHKVTNKRVSVWSFDKKGPDLERLGPLVRDRTLEVLKAEASALSRFRHPSILEMVEPFEETRTELTFATEPVLSSLELAIPGVGKLASLVELDEVEIQKGILQICKGLQFLHSSAQLIHSHLCPESVIINRAGDWKISGLGLTIPLLQPNGSATHWEFPTFDGRVPSYIQRSFDYMAPEYALDEMLLTASDMYSLGCVIYTVHCKGNPPFKTHGSLSGLRNNAGRPVPGLERLEPDLQTLLRSLITRNHNGRPTPSTLPTDPFFSSLPISTLNFLDRSNFTSKTREEKISFMKGLTNVLSRFSEGLKSRKILPSLLEEMKDSHLLPYILPNVFAISSTLTPTQFASTVLPSLKPLFAIKEPPANMLTLLDNLSMLQSKTEKSIFRTEVLPLVYNALDSEHAVVGASVHCRLPSQKLTKVEVQERALKMVPDLCDTIDYAEVQGAFRFQSSWTTFNLTREGVLFPRVALVFTKTRILSVKVGTLATFLAMVKTLDQVCYLPIALKCPQLIYVPDRQSSLTQRMVPLLSKIRTKEPAVMMATLAVQEAMGFKVDREAVATLVLPQLWSMSMGPLLSVGQFQRFMEVVKKLGERVEKEHNQFLRDSQRLEDRSAISTDGGTAARSFASTVDFESLVGGKNGVIQPNPTGGSVGSGAGNTSWDDDVWGSIFSDTTAGKLTAPSSPKNTPIQALKSGSTKPPPMNPRSFTSSSVPPLTSSTFMAPIQPAITNTFPSRLVPPLSGGPQQPQKPNYNISLPSVVPAPNALGAMSGTLPPAMSPSINNNIAMGMLTPSKPPQPSWNATKLSKDDWGDFDPLG